MNAKFIHGTAGLSNVEVPPIGAGGNRKLIVKTCDGAHYENENAKIVPKRERFSMLKS